MTHYQILFENADLLAVDKPAGDSFHCDEDKPGVASGVQSQLQCDLWPVHRLDKMTSGVLLFAKSHEAAVKINSLFQERRVTKAYIAISDKKPKKKQGKISGDMQKTRNGSWKLATSKANPAVTEFNSCGLIPTKRFFWVNPLSGKTHQIRVALKALGAPILGDSRYGGSNSDRGYLHAFQLRFEWYDETINIICWPTFGEFFLLPQIKLCVEKLCGT